KTGCFAVPLLWPEGITHCRTKVRIWADPGLQPLLEGGAWEELALEVSPERDTLPALVLRGTGLQVPLRLKEGPVAPLPTVAIDRLLVPATVGEGGHQAYRARFLIGKLTARMLEIELPAPLANLLLDLLLDGKRPAGMQTFNDEGNEVPNGRILRIHVQPELYQKPVVLDIRYQMAPSQSEGQARVQTTFYPPRLKGNVFQGRVRWYLGLPANWVPVHADHVAVEQRWGFRGWVPAPRSAVTAAELERWFTANPDSRGSAVEGGPELGTRSSEVVCWQANLAPLVL